MSINRILHLVLLFCLVIAPVASVVDAGSLSLSPSVPLDAAPGDRFTGDGSGASGVFVAAPDAAPAAGSSTPIAGETTLPPGVSADWWAGVQADLAAEGAGTRRGPNITFGGSFTGENAQDNLGFAISSAGDVNDDGYDDVLVGAYGYLTETGRVYLYLGSTEGISSTAAWTADGEAVGDRFGVTLDGAGDVNDDGYDDVVIGADYAAGSYGRAYVYHGSPTGLSVSPVWTATGELVDDYFASVVAGAGDVNGDNYDDVLVGTPFQDGGYGKAYLYQGSAGGLSITPDWAIGGELPGDGLGCSLASAGDVDGDSYDDVLVGICGYNSDQGAVELYMGSGTGLEDTPAWTVTGDAVGDRFGRSLASAGDVNADGYDDVVVSAWYATGPITGYVHLYLGSATVPSPAPNWSVYGQKAESQLGYSVASAGDVNADGYADLLIGDGELHAFLYLGADFGLPELPDWTALGELPSAEPYLAAVGAGDVDGDGYADLLLGSWGYNDGQGRAYWYRGAGAILSLAWTATGEGLDNSFALALDGAGDVNGDGYTDVLVGAPAYNLGQGKAYLYLGAADGLSTSPDWTVTGSSGESLGYSVASAGDVNGDGYADLLVGGYGYSASQGRVYLYLGSAAGPSLSPDWTATGEIIGDSFGWSVAGAGDVDGDGYADLLVGAPSHSLGQGKAYLYLGSAGGPSLSPDWTDTGEGSIDAFGSAVAGAGDVNGDGYTDVLVGARTYSESQGKAYLYLGSAAGPSLVADWTAIGEDTFGEFGTSVAGAGDVDGDGYADILVGAAYYNYGQGKAYLYRGSATGPSLVADWTAAGPTIDENFGTAVAGAGDVNGDGYADVVIGAPLYNGGWGRSCLYLGSVAGLDIFPAWLSQGGPEVEAGSELGTAVATAGDVNGDGYADVLIGAWADGDFRGQALLFQGHPAVSALDVGWAAFSEWPSDEFGAALASAGDVNGDGYDDVLVGAWGYDSARGKAYLYLGSADGLSFTPAWTATGENLGDGFADALVGAGDVNGDGYADILVGARSYDSSRGKAYLYLGSPAGPSGSPDWTATGENVYDDFADALAGAGDVNGDGYADMLVGAQSYNDNSGRVYLYLGSPAGPGASPDWTADGETTSNDFGGALAGAGDVNGDGYADVLVGAPSYNSSQGKVYLYPGSAGGLPAESTWTASGEGGSDQFGSALASAGDVNGDGYADILVGAAYYNNAQGQAYLYPGSTGGLSTEPTWTAVGLGSSDEFGSALASAGDVNGDGYADVLVGAPAHGVNDDGQTYLYPGSAAGLPAWPAWIVLGMSQMQRPEQVELGTAVASAGDVDGDGYADILVGAPYEPGYVELYHGNGGRGLSLVPGQWRTDGSAPIVPLGISDSSTAVQLRLVGRSPAGRDQVKLAWQVAPLGTPFTATGVISGTSVDWTDTLTSGVLLTETVGGLAPGMPYHWRVRLFYHPNGGLGRPAGPWMKMPLGGEEEKRLRTADGPITGLAAAADPLTALGDTTHFTATADPVYVGYAWTFDDGQEGVGAVVTHTYAVAGFYTAVVTASNTVDTVTASVVLLVEEPPAGLQAANSGPTALGQPTAFTATVTAGISVTYVWDFGDSYRSAAPGREAETAGDGAWTSGATITHTYPLPGLYTATVTASNALGQVVTGTVVLIEEAIAGLRASNDSPTALGEPTHLFADVISGTNVAYAWEFGDGAVGSGAAITHTYALSGIYTATVTASNSVSQRTATCAVTILEQQPIAGLVATSDSPTVVGWPTRLAATVAAGDDVSYTWSLGDGAAASGAQVTHVYEGAGIYPAVVTASNDVSLMTATTVVSVAVAIPLSPAFGGRLTFSDTQGLTTTILIPPGAVTQTVLLAYFPVLTPTQPFSPGLQFANHAFVLEIYPYFATYLPLVWRGEFEGLGSGPSRLPTVQAALPRPATAFQGTPQLAGRPGPDAFAFAAPVTITIHYSDDDVAGLDENTLRVLYWTGTAWADAADTCVPASPYVRDLANNVLSVAVCHLTEFAMIGQ